MSCDSSISDGCNGLIFPPRAINVGDTTSSCSFCTGINCDEHCVGVGGNACYGKEIVLYVGLPANLGVDGSGFPYASFTCYD
jgi:hypothetical protein